MSIAELNEAREPEYYTVKRHLLEIIGPLPAASSIPTKREIAVRLSTSRTTVRQALIDLVAEGRSVRRHGSGTFIAEPKVTWRLEMTSFTEQAATNGVSASTHVIMTERVRAGVEVAARLELTAGAPVFRIERLRLADERPMAVETSHLSAARFPMHAQPICRQESLHAVLREHRAVVPFRAEAQVSAAPASPRVTAI